MWNLVKYLTRKAAGRMPKLLSVGAKAPEFDVQDHRGMRVASKALLGKRYVLWFYPKADTPG
jgi:peroxiredoxin Q/BCP